MNDKDLKLRNRAVTVLSLVALVCVLSYTFWHTGALLARYIIPGVLGYTAAAGIELTVIAMSLQVDAKRGRVFWFVFVAALTVSALANTAEGFRVSQGVELTSRTFQLVDPVVALVGLAATGLLSGIVMSLADLLGATFDMVADIARALAGAGVSTGKPAPGGTPVLDTGRKVANDTQRYKKEANMQHMLAIIAGEPAISKSKLAGALGVSRATVNNYLAEFEQLGTVSVNGDGYTVKEM